MAGSIRSTTRPRASARRASATEPSTIAARQNNASTPTLTLMIRRSGQRVAPAGRTRGGGAGGVVPAAAGGGSLFAPAGGGLAGGVGGVLPPPPGGRPAGRTRGGGAGGVVPAAAGGGSFSASAVRVLPVVSVVLIRRSAGASRARPRRGRRPAPHR